MAISSTTSADSHGDVFARMRREMSEVEGVWCEFSTYDHVPNAGQGTKL
jgi:hypothetical protein